MHQHRDDAITDGVRCLIVDDDQQFLAVAENYLERQGLGVVGTATSRAEAMQQARALRPNIVLVDIGLGADSGFEVTRRLVDEFPQLQGRVVLISSSEVEDCADLMADSRASGFIPTDHLSGHMIEKVLGATAAPRLRCRSADAIAYSGRSQPSVGQKVRSLSVL